MLTERINNGASQPVCERGNGKMGMGGAGEDGGKGRDKHWQGTAKGRVSEDKTISVQDFFP